MGALDGCTGGVLGALDGITGVYMDGCTWMGVHGGIALDGCTWGHWMGVHGWVHGSIALDGCTWGHWMGVHGWVYMGALHWMGVHGGIALDGCTWRHWMGVHGWVYMGALHWMGVHGGIGWVCLGHCITWVYIYVCTWGIGWVEGIGWVYMGAFDGCAWRACGVWRALDGECACLAFVPVQLHGLWFQSNSSRPWFHSDYFA